MQEKEIEVYEFGGELYPVVERCCCFVIFRDASDQEVAQPYGKAEMAMSKVVFHTNDRTKISNEERYARLYRAETLEYAMIVGQHFSNQKQLSKEAINLLAKRFALAFSEVIRVAVYEEEADKALSGFRNVMESAMRALRNKYILVRDAPRDKKRRVLVALNIGRKFYLEHRTPPSKQYIRAKLEEESLGFQTETKKTKEKLWRLFWPDCGLAELPD
jgi:hypothetical protein